MGSKRFAAYTAIFGAYDTFVQIYQGNFDYFLFTEKKIGPGWGKCMVTPREFEDATRDARRLKILAHRFLPEYEYTLWLDGAIRCDHTIDPERLIETWLQGKFDLATFRHPERNCVYEEARIVAGYNRDKPELVQAQMDRYREAKYPVGRGLAETAIILRRNCPETARFNELWWEEVQAGSRRDQLSFPVAAWRTGLKVNFLGGVFTDHGYKKELHLRELI